MSRLTEKGKRIRFVYGRGSAKSPNYEQIIEAQRYNKLAKLEDLEEELGCPLDVLAKLMLNGFYYEYPEYDDNDEPTGKMELIYDDFTGITYLVKGTNNEIYIDVRYLDDPLKLADYKTTWWLKENRSE